MSLGFLIGTGLTSEYDVNPNSLTTVDPFGNGPLSNGQVSAQWTTQAIKAFFPRTNRNPNTEDKQTQLFFSIKAGGTITTNDTIVVSIFFFDRKAKVWYAPAGSSPETYDVSIDPNILDHVDGITTDLPFFLKITPLTGLITYDFRCDANSSFIL